VGFGGFPAGTLGLEGPGQTFRLFVAVALAAAVVHAGLRARYGRSAPAPLETGVTVFLGALGAALAHGLLASRWLALPVALLAFMLTAWVVHRVRWSHAAGIGAGSFAAYAAIGFLLSLAVA
jgi:hypothetical protein